MGIQTDIVYDCNGCKLNTFHIDNWNYNYLIKKNPVNIEFTVVHDSHNRYIGKGKECKSI